jgi:hypothetical protein
MELDWSEQSPHIRTLFRPWRPGDGYDEATFQAAEARLGLRLPATLRRFYLAWGRRHDLIQMVDPLVPPDALKLFGDVLSFWVENQAVVLWGIRRERLEEADPPVVVAWNEEGGLDWTPSHARLSDFLDDLTYQHALDGGALYLGRSREVVQEPQHLQWLEKHWSKARVGPACFHKTPDAPWWPTLFIREGQVLFWEDSWWRVKARREEEQDGIVQTYFWDSSQWRAAGGSAEALREIAEALQITWEVPKPDLSLGPPW